MKKYLLLLLLLVTKVVAAPLESLPATTSTASTSLLWIKLSPFGAGDDKKITLGNLSLGITPTFANVSGKPNTLDGYGITDAVVAAGKIFTASNTLTLSGTDGSTLNVGTGGTLGTAAYTASGAYEVPLTFGTGLTRSVNTITVNTSQNIATLSNLTGNGFVKTGGGVGTLSVDTTSYQTLDSTLTTLSGLGITGTGSISRNILPTFQGLVTSSINGNVFTAGSGTLTLGTGKTVTLNNTITINGTDGTTMTLPTTSASLARRDGDNTFTGTQAISVNGAASAPPLSLTGTWFTGGTATTTKPLVLIEPTGTTSTAWNTSGTGIGVNAPSGFVGYLVDGQLAGVSKFRVSTTGKVESVAASNTLAYVVGGSSGIGPSGDNSMDFWFSNSIFANFSGEFAVGSAGAYAFSSAASGSTIRSTKDTFLYRESPGVIQHGADHATTPTAQTTKAHDVTTGTGAKMIVAGGKGSGAGGRVELATSASTAAPSAALIVEADGTLDLARSVVSGAVSVVSTDKIAIKVNGVTYYLLVTTVP